MNVTTTTQQVQLVGRCSHAGCELTARWMVTAAADGRSATTFACDDCRPDQEVHALRMLADSLEQRLAELSRDRQPQRTRLAAIAAGSVRLAALPFPAPLEPR